MSLGGVISAWKFTVAAVCSQNVSLQCKVDVIVSNSDARQMLLSPTLLSYEAFPYPQHLSSLFACSTSTPVFF